MALNFRVDPSTGDQRCRMVQARAEPIIDKPISHEPVGETPEEKLERQKRRAAIGKRYLEGRGAPFILSALLKGPFDKASGWKNPWLSEEPVTEEDVRPLPRNPLQKAFRNNPPLTGRQRNGSVVSTRSIISIGSASQSQAMAGDKLCNARQQPPRPNLHGGLKHFLGSAPGATPSSTRKLDRDNLPQLPAQKRKAEISWLRGADIVKKRRRELPDLPSPTPPTRVRDQQRQFVTPTNLLDKFRQHSQSQFAQETPTNRRPAITSSQGSAMSHVDIPTPSQGYSPPFKRQRRSLMAARSPDSVVRKETSLTSKYFKQDDKVFAKSKLNQANRRSTSNASALQNDVLTHEEPVRALAGRVRLLNEDREVSGPEGFKFRRTKRAISENVSENVVSSIERDDDDVASTNGEVEPDLPPKITQVGGQPAKKPVANIEPIASVAADHRDEPHEALADDLDDQVVKNRVRNSRSLPSDSETESPEKSRLPVVGEQSARISDGSGAATKADGLSTHDLSSQVFPPSTAEEQAAFSNDASRSQMAQHQLTTIPEVKKTTGIHADLSMPAANTCTTATESLVMDVVEDEMLHEDEGDTTMPDIPHSNSDDHHMHEKSSANSDQAIVEEVAETTYVQMASGSISTGSILHGSQNTAMNTQAIEAIKANLLGEEGDEGIMAPIPECTSGLEDVVHEKEESSGQSLHAQRRADRLQISSSSVPTNTETTSTISQNVGIASTDHRVLQQGSQPDSIADDILRIPRSSQRREDSSYEKTPTQRDEDNGSGGANAGATIEEQHSSNLPGPVHEQEAVVASPSFSPVYSHTDFPFKSSQVDALVQSQFQSQAHGQIHFQLQAVPEDDRSSSTDTGTTTTESLLIQAIAHDMAREDEGGISMTGLTHSTNEKNSGEQEDTPNPSLSQRTMASRAEEVLVENSSNEQPQHAYIPMTTLEVLPEPETQSWHISVIEDSTMMEVDSDAAEEPQPAGQSAVMQNHATSPPAPSMIPAYVEKAPSVHRTPAPISLSHNPWLNDTQLPSKSTPAPAASSKRVAFSDHPSSSSVDDDGLDLPQQQHGNNHMPSSPPPRLSVSAQSPERAPVIFSQPPVYHEPPSTESPFPVVINGLRNRQPQLPVSSQGVGGMANAFLTADELVPIREEAPYAPLFHSDMAPPSRHQTPPPQSDASKPKAGQSSVARQLAMMYPSSSEDEVDQDSPIRSRQSQSRSRQSQSQREESPIFASQENYQARKPSPSARAVSRVPISRSPSTITDPYANPWLTQALAEQEVAKDEEEEEEEEYDELPPFAFGNIMGMLGEGFGSGRPEASGEDEGMGAVVDEMSDLLETWDVDEELSKARRKSNRASRDGREDRDKRSSARERVGWGRF